MIYQKRNKCLKQEEPCHFLIKSIYSCYEIQVLQQKRIPSAISKDPIDNHDT